VLQRSHARCDAQIPRHKNSRNSKNHIELVIARMDMQIFVRSYWLFCVTRLHSAADSHELRPLTGIRGFAAVLVMLFHFYGFWVLLLPSISVASRAINRGGLGVDLFFILSGFILSYVYNAGSRRLTLPDYGKFLWFRIARVYPNHLATLLFLVFLVMLAPILRVALIGSYPIDDLPYQLTLTHTWPFAPVSAVSVWNFPAWSISAEWFAYLAVFPVVAFLLPRIGNAAMALALGFGALVAWCFIGTKGHLVGSPLIQVSFEFFAGGMFFRVFTFESGVVRFSQRCLSGLFVILLVLLCCPPTLGVYIGTLSVFPLLLLGLTSEVSLVARLFSTGPALWLGRASYSLYMSHGIALKFVKIFLPATRYVHSSLAVRGLVFLGNLLIIFAMMACLYYLIEIPGRNFLRKIRFARNQ
jgi:peptidoglycan/LPS O-acetylase OafA/YrhL